MEGVAREARPKRMGEIVTWHM
ncbi:hypothetical protein CCACVL1_28591, partial [Corchorus capsularis]